MLIGCASNLAYEASKGNIKGVQTYIDKGANINEWVVGMSVAGTPLMHAAGEGHVNVVKLLIARGAKVNVRSKDGTQL